MKASHLGLRMVHPSQLAESQGVHVVGRDGVVVCGGQGGGFAHSGDNNGIPFGLAALAGIVASLSSALAAVLRLAASKQDSRRHHDDQQQAESAPISLFHARSPLIFPALRKRQMESAVSIYSIGFFDKKAIDFYNLPAVPNNLCLV